jgi:hypothetical protein
VTQLGAEVGTPAGEHLAKGAEWSVAEMLTLDLGQIPSPSRDMYDLATL